MSKTFKEWLEIGGRQDHYGEYDMEESWDAAQKAMLDEVINRFENCRNMVDFNYALNEYIRDFGLKDE